MDLWFTYGARHQREVFLILANKAQAKEVVQAWHAAWDFFPLTQEAKDQREVALFFNDVTGAS